MGSKLTKKKDKILHKLNLKQTKINQKILPFQIDSKKKWRKESEE